MVDKAGDKILDNAAANLVIRALEESADAVPATGIHASDVNSVVVHTVGIDAIDVAQDFSHVGVPVKATLGATPAINAERSADGKIGSDLWKGCSLANECAEG